MAIIKCFLLAACVVYVSSATTRVEPVEHRSAESGRSDDGDFGLNSGMKILLRAYDQCDAADDTFGCLKGKALRFVDRALHTEAIPLLDGVALVKTTPEITDARALTDNDVVDASNVDGLLVDRMSRFVGTHSLQLNMPKITENAKELLGDARGHKLKKMGPAILMAMMMKGGMVALAFKAVAILAAKALMVAKIALVLAAVIGLSKLAHKGESKVSYEIVKHPHISHGHTHTSSVVHEGGHGGGWESGGGGGGSSGGHGGWELGGSSGGGGHFRSLDASQSEFVPHVMAYRGQVSQQQIDDVEAKQ